MTIYDTIHSQNNQLDTSTQPIHKTINLTQVHNLLQNNQLDTSTQPIHKTINSHVFIKNTKPFFFHSFTQNTTLHEVHLSIPLNAHQMCPLGQCLCAGYMLAYSMY